MESEKAQSRHGDPFGKPHSKQRSEFKDRAQVPCAVCPEHRKLQLAGFCPIKPNLE